MDMMNESLGRNQAPVEASGTQSFCPAARQSRAGQEILQATTPPDAPFVDIRPLMSTFPTGVCIIAAMATDGCPWGMTCTSVCSVTLEPPTLLVCLRRGSPTLAAVLASDEFALNLLYDHARSTAELFASGIQDRFARVAWHMPAASAGPHLLEVAHAIADCQVVHTKAVGSHMVVFGEVRKFSQQMGAVPLLYGFRRYARWPTD